MNQARIERPAPQSTLPADDIWWYDGLLLDEAHFQQLSRRQEDLISYHMRNVAPYGWGVRRLELDDLALTGGVFAVTRLEAVLPDGLVVAHNAGPERAAGKLELVLDEQAGPALAAAGKFATICLAVPANTRVGAADPLARYAPVDADPHDGVERMRPRLRLALASELDAGSGEVALPLARVTFRLDRYELLPYLPPLLDIGVAPACLNAASLRADSTRLLRAMQRAAESLAAVTAPSPVDQADQLRRMELRQRLHGVTAAIPVLQAVLGLPAVSPLALYLAWSGALGALGVLDETGAVLRRPWPEYRHDELYGVFRSLFQRTADLLKMANREFDQIALRVNPDRQYSHAFQPGLGYRWAAARVDADGPPGQRQEVLIVGLRNMARADAGEWMAGAVITTSHELRSYRSGRSMGAPRSAIEADGALRPLGDAAGPGDWRIEVRGMATPDIVLFAVLPDGVLAPDGDIVLQNPAAAQPSEIVLFVRKVQP